MGVIVEVDEKGRIVIPKEIRNQLGLRDGTQLVAEIRGDDIVLSPIVTEQTMQGIWSRCHTA